MTLLRWEGAPGLIRRIVPEPLALPYCLVVPRSQPWPQPEEFDQRVADLRAELVRRGWIKEEIMARPPADCELATKQADWGNYCPRDPHGVHHCTQKAGEQHEADHTCECGARKPTHNPFPPVNSGIPWRAEA